ncbi:MAG: DMT family transporter [Cyanobacteria bacterium P01_F01_bin.33]
MTPQQLSPEQGARRATPASVIGLCIALLSVACAPIFIRLSETELGANGTVFNRLFVFFVVFGLGRWLASAFSSAGDCPLSPPSRRQYLLLASLGILSTASLGLWAVSLQYTTVAKSVLLNNLTPIFTTMGAWLLFGRRFDKTFLLGMGVALLGAIALGAEDIFGSSMSLVGDCLALLSAVFFSGYLLAVEQLRARFSATTILLWRCAVGSALLLPITWVTEGQIFPTTDTAVFAVLGLGIVSEGLGQRLLADSLNTFTSSFIALLSLLEPIFSAILAWFAFVEQLSPMTWVGFAIVLGGIYLAQTSQGATQVPAPVPVETVEAELGSGRSAARA